MRMNGTRKNKGFTLAEILIVIAIVGILAGVAFIAVERHQRSTTLLEMDGVAKEIFVAAQNHLSLADSQGLLALRSGKGAQYAGVSDYYKAKYVAAATAGGMDEDEALAQAARLDVRYFIVPADSVTDEASVLSLMLPQAAVDEAVRLGGSYVVIYDCNSATVLDVFYSAKSGDRFAFDFTGYSGAQVAELLNTFAGDGNKNGRKTAFSEGKSIIGWYGGAFARPTADPNKELKIRNFEIVNGDRLYAVIPNPNPEDDKKSFAELRLHVHGVTSGKDQIIDLVQVVGNLPTYPNGAPDASGNFIVVLDDVTSSGKHFAELFPDFIPGEDIELTLEAYSSTEIVTMPAPIGPKTTNSLFASVGGGTAEVASFRHLENLDANVSGFDGAGLSVTGAAQTTNLDWSDFVAATADGEGHMAVTGANPTDPHNPKTSKNLGGGQDNYYPVDMPDGFDYDGQGNSVKGVTIDYTAGDYAGLFGTINGGTVENLELVNFRVSGTNAGALAGRITGLSADPVAVKNVVARLEAGADYASRAVSGTGSVGGLVGFVNGENSKVTNCAAAVGVSSSGGDAGGLIGSVGGSNVKVTGCYSGGHTVNGKYTSYNITAAGSAGGLVGDAGSAELKQCYSTCSAQGDAAGGLAGNAAGKLTGCYATGLVDGSAGKEGALVGVYTGAAADVDDCLYYMIVNEYVDGSGLAARVSYAPYFGASSTTTSSSGVTALDQREDIYNGFVGAPSAWTAAEPYDGALMSYYLANGQTNFPLESVRRLGATVSAGDFVATHYGDWPAPELWVKNQS